MMSLSKKIQNFKIREYLEKKEIEYRENSSHFILQNCPFCNKHKPKLYVDKNIKSFYCFLCESGEKKNIFHLVAELEGKEYYKILNEYGDENVECTNLNTDKLQSVDFINKTELIKECNIEISKINLPFNFCQFTNRNNPYLDLGYKYLLERGIPV